MIWLTTALGLGLEKSGLDLAYRGHRGRVVPLQRAQVRTFSPLDASRPEVANEKTAVAGKNCPRWMPPPLAFPIIWSTIALLRAASSVAIFVHVGSLDVPAVHAMLLHLAVGDTWNSINNVERRLGVAVVGVGCVLLSVYNVVLQYWKVTPNARGTSSRRARCGSRRPCCVWTICGPNQSSGPGTGNRCSTRRRVAAEAAAGARRRSHQEAKTSRWTREWATERRGFRKAFESKRANAAELTK